MAQVEAGERMVPFQTTDSAKKVVRSVKMPQ